MSFSRYGQYKDTGVEWLGEVPKHWHVCPVGTIAQIVNGYPFDSERFSTTEGYPLVRIRDLNQTATDTKYNGSFVESAAITSSDVLIGMDGDFNVGRWLGSEKALLNQRMCCVRAQSDLLTRLLEHTLPIPLRAINDLTYATTVKHLSSSQIEKTRIALPEDLDEQAGLLSFLDDETAKIDALIEEQQRLIELLKEKRQAVISHVVTKGLDPAVPMKECDVDWIGEVPRQWFVTRLGYFATVENGTTPSKEKLEYWTDGSVPWLASGEVNQLRIVEANEFITEQALAESSLRLLREGTVVVGLVGQGKTRGMSAILYMTATINQNLAAVCPGPNISSEYVFYLFQAMYVSLREDGRGGNQAAINCKMLASLQIPVPPLQEQHDIAHFLNTLTEQTDSLEKEANGAIQLLQERRAALISAAVTGKIDVRNYTPKEAA